MSRRNPQAPAEVLLHRDLSSSQQVGMLLSICHPLIQVLFSTDREAENIPGKRTLSGEARLAAENTFIKVCDRLDTILDDKARWGIDYQLKLEQQYNERHSQQIALMEAQQKAAEQQKASAAAVVAPHFRYKPALIPLEDGAWAAFLGNVEDLDSGILGVGPSPGAALKSFDDAFNGELTPAVKNWLEQHEKDLESGVKTTLPFPIDEHSKKLEQERDQAVETPPQEGPPDTGDQSDSEPKP